MRERFNSIVATVDPERQSESTFDVAARLASDGNLPLEVVSVEPRTTAYLSAAEDETPAMTASHPTATTFDLDDDDPMGTVVDYVTNRDGVLMVMSVMTWRYSDYELDAAGNRVLGQVHQPVLVLGPRITQDPSMTDLLVAVDGTGAADASIPVVDAWLNTFPGFNATMVEVVPPTTVPIAADQTSRHVRHYVDQLARRGVVASAHLLRALQPAPALLAHAEVTTGSVLVICSPRWAGEPSHWFRTLRYVLHFSTRPVLVVPSDRLSH